MELVQPGLFSRLPPVQLRQCDRSVAVAGDQLLKSATAAWQSRLRSSDLLARYGGERFAVLFPATTLNQALEIVTLAEYYRRLCRRGVRSTRCRSTALRCRRLSAQGKPGLVVRR